MNLYEKNPISLYSWLDVDAVIKSNLQSDQDMKKICSIQTFSDGIDVQVIDSTTLGKVEEALRKWFGTWYDDTKKVIFLSKRGSVEPILPVNIEVDQLQAPVTEIKPLFSDIALFSEISATSNRPRPFLRPINMMAFYSFKGGVGRTVHLISALKAFDNLNKNKNKKVLVVDGDLEAPGLTWWAKDKGQSADFSFLDLLAVANYDDSEEFSDTLDLAYEHLITTPLVIENSSFYFLPAFRTLQQLLSFPIRPEHLTTGKNRSWIIVDILYKLAERLGVDSVFIDLRAGLSELTAPILFDPRVTRILVTTCAYQSVEGIKIVLHELGKCALLWRDQNEFPDPVLIVSMITDDLKESKRYEKIQEQLMESYSELLSREDFEPNLINTEFLPAIVNIGSLDSLWQALSGSLLYKKMAELVADLFSDTEDAGDKKKQIDLKAILQKLQTRCEKIEYAESGVGEEYLKIPGIANLAQRFLTKLPIAVVLGSKGAGKTHLFLQLARLQEWRNFQQDVKISSGDIQNSIDAMLFPFIESNALKERTRELTEQCRQSVWNQLTVTNSSFKQFELRDAVSCMISRENMDRQTWRLFWIDQIGRALGLPKQDEIITIDQIQHFLHKKGKRIIILIDGLENILPEVTSDKGQELALGGLLDVPEVLKEYRESSLGCICLVRRDFVRAVMKQNLGQYENLYRPYELEWNFKEALRLVYWLYQRAIEQDGDHLNFSQDDLKERLIPLWGRKLGSNQSKEANSANWILAALSDFQGQLQARDVVRFIKEAAGDSNQIIEAAEKNNKRTFYPDRLLQPNAIRHAIEPCSKKKVEEFKEEFVNFGTIFAKLENKDETERKIPFVAKQFNLSVEECEQLINVGLLKKVDDKFFMPEIFRYGLGFTLERGARPKVLALMRKFL